MDKKKVVGFSFIPLGWNGNVLQGMPSVLFGQKGLVDHGYDAHYFVYTNKNEDFDIEGIHCHHRKIKCVHSNKNALLYYLTDRLFWYENCYHIMTEGEKIVKQLHPSLIVAHGRYSVPAVSHLGKKYGIPTVYREYGSTVMYKAMDSAFRRFLMKPQFFALKKKVDLYVFTDDGTRGKDVAIHEGISPDKILFLKNGVFNCDNVKPYDRNEEGQFLICSAARLSKEKYFDVIIEAFSIIRNKYENVKLYIIGDGPEKEKLVSMTSALGVDASVHFEGVKNREEVMRYYKTCDVSVCLGSINPLLESMASGVAAITLDLGATGELIHNMDNGIKINKPEAQELANAIGFMYLHDEERKKIAHQGYKTIKENYYTWEERINIEIDAYTQLMNRL